MIRVVAHCANPSCDVTYEPSEFLGEYIVDEACREAGWSYGWVMTRSTDGLHLMASEPILACSPRCLGIVKALLAPIEFPDVDWIAPCRSGAS